MLLLSIIDELKMFIIQDPFVAMFFTMWMTLAIEGLIESIYNLGE